MPRPPLVSPFQRLTRLIEGVAPGASPIDLGVGEPRHPMPAFVAPVMTEAMAGFGRYPPIRGTDQFRAAVAAWLDRRYGLDGLIDPATMVLPLDGSREGLFFAALGALRHGGKTVERPVVLIPNPFYFAYAAGAEAIGAETVTIGPASDATALPDLAALDPALLERTIALYVASPANPQGSVASKAEWRRLIEIARAHKIWVFADECYSELYREGAPPPAGALEAAKETGSLDRVVVFNSLSKRSNLAGLRCGFAAGDPAFIAPWTSLRNIAAPQVPLPVQAVGAAAFADEAHVAENRRLYDAKFALAERLLGPIFGPVTPAAGFFLWLDVARFGGGEAAALHLWRSAGIRAVPGGYLAAGHGADAVNPGADRLRIALVDDASLTETALGRLAEAFS
ncbi:aminotransferase class I/II-fold pyridoxal phosphate-dependent enzyme [Segnochrobactrum spirostomi]|uniref:aminotransferase class I/II-fold pyridoxal phosphate-dependent enzyme n=1 Tax=Segnochrobactrum spirostomi TaxID=2608987 RepID=UPI0028A70C1A|nr:aminotransferase class I/II-fold pyridoxal phosphate-dependent enzyme [Segnochrobactrum spirostomi]